MNDSIHGDQEKSFFLTSSHKKSITILLDDYNELKEKADLLEELWAEGVDNWEGYGEAVSRVYDEED
jgi:hypothetical protein